MEFQELILKVTKILEKMGAVYCFTGGYAVSWWGRPRGTFDLDLIIQLEISQLNLLTKELKKLSKAGYLSEELAREKIKTDGEFNFIHPESGLKINFWVVNKNKIGQEELKRRVAKKINGQKIYLIAPEDLILSKLRWAEKSESTRHIEDARSVFKIQKNKLDLVYLKKEAKKQQIEEVFDTLINRIK